MGNVFEGGADLTVLPCGAKPSWTSAVNQWIERFKLPTPRQLMPTMRLSDVTPTAHFPGPKNITKFIAYGASVLNDPTTPEAIEKLGANIGKITRSNSDIRIVESVLFGTGYGRLSDTMAAEALTRGFQSTAQADSQLWIWVFGHDRHATVSKAIEAATIRENEPIQKFRDTREKFGDIRIAVIVALAEEYKLFIQYFQGTVVEKFHVDNLTIDILKRDGQSERIGLVSVNRMGNVAAAIAATRLLEIFDLDLVVNVGLAAGVDSESQHLGDIIVADKIRYYETGKLKDEQFDVAPEFANLHSLFVQSLQSANWETWPLGASLSGRPRRVFFGTVASGEKVVANQEFVTILKGYDRKTVGIEMESYGIAAAVHGRKEKFLLVRGITDFADAKKHDNARLSAMEGAIRFLNEALRRGCFSSPQKPVSSVISSELILTLKSREVIEGVANNYVEIARSHFVDKFRFRKSVIEKMASRFTFGGLRNFCIELGVYFHEMKGETNLEKAASILEFLEKKTDVTIEILDSLIEDATEGRANDDEEKTDLNSAESLISIDAVILKGGGVKGLAFAGALIELQKYYEFKSFVGTSAGAVAAVLLASGYSGRELEAELRQKRFRDFLDGNFIIGLLKNLAGRGLHPGYAFVDWLRLLLHDRLRRASDIRMKDLPKRAVVYATWRDGEVTFDSHGDHADTAAYAAVRCSMSIPFFFWPQLVDGKHVYDGGWLNNYPLVIFLSQETAAGRPPPSFIAIYLGRDTPRSIKPRSTVAELLSGNLERNDASIIDKYRSQTILIDTDPVGTIDFDLTDAEKDFLVTQGQAAALEFLGQKKLLDVQGLQDLQQIKARANKLQQQAATQRDVRRRRTKLAMGVAMIVAVAIGAMTFFRSQQFCLMEKAFGIGCGEVWNDSFDAFARAVRVRR